MPPPALVRVVRVIPVRGLVGQLTAAARLLFLLVFLSLQLLIFLLLFAAGVGRVLWVVLRRVSVALFLALGFLLLLLRLLVTRVVCKSWWLPRRFVILFVLIVLRLFTLLPCCFAASFATFLAFLRWRRSLLNHFFLRLLWLFFRFFFHFILFVFVCWRRYVLLLGRLLASLSTLLCSLGLLGAPACRRLFFVIFCSLVLFDSRLSELTDLELLLIFFLILFWLILVVILREIPIKKSKLMPIHCLKLWLSNRYRPILLTQFLDRVLLGFFLWFHGNDWVCIFGCFLLLFRLSLWCCSLITWLLHRHWSLDIFSGGLIYEMSIMLDFTVKQSVQVIPWILAQVEIRPIREFQMRILAMLSLFFGLFLLLFFLFLLDFEGPRVDLESFLEASAEPGVSLGVRQRFAPLFGRKLGFELHWRRG